MMRSFPTASSSAQYSDHSTIAPIKLVYDARLWSEISDSDLCKISNFLKFPTLAFPTLTL